MEGHDPGAALRSAMRNKNVKPGDLVAVTGASPNVVSNWRRRGVAKAHVEDVASFLNVRPELIAAVTPPPSTNTVTLDHRDNMLAFSEKATRDRQKQAQAVSKADTLSKEELREELTRAYRDLDTLREQLTTLKTERAVDEDLIQDYRARRILKLIGDERLSPRDLDLLEELIHRMLR